VIGPTQANVAIAEALGLDPTHIRSGGVTIHLDSDRGPVVTVEYFVTDRNGKRHTINEELVTELRRYKLVPLDKDES